MLPINWLPITSCAQFYTFIEASDLVVCYVTAPWCFRCKQVAEKIANFPADWPDISFLAVDLEECEQLGELLGIATLPTFALFAHGVEVARLEGVPQQRPARAVAQAIRQHLLGRSASSAGRGGGGGGGHSSEGMQQPDLPRAQLE
ncbi:Thioredoxin [Chlorella vulgaris]